MFGQLPGVPDVLYGYKFAKWVDSGSRFCYRDTSGRNFLCQVGQKSSRFLFQEDTVIRHGNVFPRFQYSVSPDGRCYALVYQALGRLRVINLASDRLLYETAIAPEGPGFPYYFDELFKFTATGNKLAYISHPVQGTDSTFLIVLTISGSSVAAEKTTIQANHLGEIFTDQFIELINDVSASWGLFLLNCQPRNVSYYNRLYPRLTMEQKREMGIPLF